MLKRYMIYHVKCLARGSIFKGNFYVDRHSSSTMIPQPVTNERLHISDPVPAMVPVVGMEATEVFMNDIVVYYGKCKKR